MAEKLIHDTAEKAADSVSHALGVDRETTITIIEMFFDRLIDCLRSESTFTIPGFGKFYFKYGRARMVSEQQAHYLAGKCRKSLEFKLATMMDSDLEGWVHDLGFKTNERTELKRVKIQPEEIEKVRRKKNLEEQRAVGFRSELLFEDPPETDRIIERGLGRAPTVDDLIRRIGLNLKM
jgi:nucleoid DNA-binding protein